MRRKDREMDKKFAFYVTDKCDYAVISMVTPDGVPYCLPITIARDEEIIYFHSALDGLKVDVLRENPNVCISCVGDTNKPDDKFTTEFESSIIRGKAFEVEDNAEKIHALKLICQRHSPNNMDNFDKATEKSLCRTGVWKVVRDSITGKRKKYDDDGKEMKFGRMK